MANSNGSKMSREEAGRLGGVATARNHDREFYQAIGRKGGEATAESHDREFYQEIGRRGGEATSETHDRDFYQEIGRKGGIARVEGGENSVTMRREQSNGGEERSRRRS